MYHNQVFFLPPLSTPTPPLDTGLRVWFLVECAEGGTGNVNCLCPCFVLQACSTYVAASLPLFAPSFCRPFCVLKIAHIALLSAFLTELFQMTEPLRFFSPFWTVPATERTMGQPFCVHLATGSSCLFLLQTHRCFLMHTKMQPAVFSVLI